MKARWLLLSLSFPLVVAAAAPQAGATPRLDAAGSCNPAVGGNLGPVPGLDCSATEQLLPAPPGSSARSGRDWIDARLGTTNSAGFEAAADFGMLRARSYARVSSAPPLGTSTPLAHGFGAGSFALAVDDITFGAPGLAGQAGFANGSILVEGALAVSVTDSTAGSALARWRFTVQALAGGRIQASSGAEGSLTIDSTGLTGQPIVSQTIPFSMPIVFGQTGQLLLRLNTQASGVARPAGEPGTPEYLLPVASEASSRFLNTVTWQGLESVTLADGTPVEGWSVTSASGVDYSRPVPEPGTALLALTGFLGLAARRRRAPRASASRPSAPHAAAPPAGSGSVTSIALAL